MALLPKKQSFFSRLLMSINICRIYKQKYVVVTTNFHLHLVIKDYFKRLLIMFYYCDDLQNLCNTHIVYDSKQPLTTRNVVVKPRGFKTATAQSPAQVLARCESSDENRILVVVIFHQTEDWLHGDVPSRPCLFSVNTSDVWLFCRLTDISLFKIALCLSMKQHGANCFIFVTRFVFQCFLVLYLVK